LPEGLWAHAAAGIKLRPEQASRAAAVLDRLQADLAAVMAQRREIQAALAAALQRAPRAAARADAATAAAADAADAVRAPGAADGAVDGAAVPAEGGEEELVRALEANVVGRRRGGAGAGARAVSWRPLVAAATEPQAKWQPKAEESRPRPHASVDGRWRHAPNPPRRRRRRAAAAAAPPPRRRRAAAAAAAPSPQTPCARQPRAPANPPAPAGA
jgi:hypothetical protein